MIKLTKLPEPKVLIKNSKQWADLHLMNISNGIESTHYLKSKYNHKEIKEQLIKETSGKCAYCESKLRHIHHGDIEHIYPKSLDESKRFEWENLTLSCEICNQNKSDIDPWAENIQDPYSGDPENELIFTGPIAFGITMKGDSTQRILKLNRSALIERRTERLEKLQLILQKVCDPQIPQSVRKVIYDDFVSNEVDNTNEYTSMAKSLLKQVLDITTKKLYERC
ncbi:HNH endonuclease [Yersinia aldovae]|uniref:HNH endonuclease n=1 Tax=Yersinia aldovae TaxID=29483 RepID=UPI00119F2D9B|nr:HNH endonuclease [Yersinia aldovae]